MYICFDVMQAVLFMLHNVLEFTIWNYSFKYLFEFDSIYSYIKVLLHLLQSKNQTSPLSF